MHLYSSSIIIPKLYIYTWKCSQERSELLHDALCEGGVVVYPQLLQPAPASQSEVSTVVT